MTSVAWPQHTRMDASLLPCQSPPHLPSNSVKSVYLYSWVGLIGSASGAEVTNKFLPWQNPDLSVESASCSQLHYRAPSFLPNAMENAKALQDLKIPFPKCSRLRHSSWNWMTKHQVWDTRSAHKHFRHIFTTAKTSAVEWQSNNKGMYQSISKVCYPKTLVRRKCSHTQSVW